MNESGITVADLLKLNPDVVQLSITRAYVKEANGAPASASIPGFVAQQAASAVVGALRTDVFGLFFGALGALRELHEYADVKQHPHGVVKWGKCSLKAPQEIELQLGEIGIPGRPLTFTLEMSAVFQSLILRIENGAIRSVTPGSGKATVGLRYRDKEVVPDKSTPEVSFGKEIPIPGGLPIL